MKDENLGMEVSIIDCTWTILFFSEFYSPNNYCKPLTIIAELVNAPVATTTSQLPRVKRGGPAACWSRKIRAAEWAAIRFHTSSADI